MQTNITVLEEWFKQNNLMSGDKHQKIKALITKKFKSMRINWKELISIYKCTLEYHTQRGLSVKFFFYFFFKGIRL